MESLRQNVHDDDEIIIHGGDMGWTRKRNLRKLFIQRIDDLTTDPFRPCCLGVRRLEHDIVSPVSPDPIHSSPSQGRDNFLRGRRGASTLQRGVRDNRPSFTLSGDSFVRLVAIIPGRI